MDARIEAFAGRARVLEDQGVPFPTVAVRAAIERAAGTHDPAKLRFAVERAERLLDGTLGRWTPVREVISHAEVLRTTAEELGINVQQLEEHIGNPRALVQAGPLSVELFDNAQKMAASSVEFLARAIPEHCLAEARKLGSAIQAAQRRGEDVHEATATFRALLRAIRGEPSPLLVQRLAAARRAVGQIPSAPAVAFPDIDDAEEILLEARILARRIHRIKRNARDAQSAARLMTHVRAALSEDRRAASPQEEIEELWGEVTRLTRDQTSGAKAPAVPQPAPIPENVPPPVPYLPMPDTSDGESAPPSRGRSRAAVRNA